MASYEKLPFRFSFTLSESSNIEEERAVMSDVSELVINVMSDLSEEEYVNGGGCDPDNDEEGCSLLYQQVGYMLMRMILDSQFHLLHTCHAWSGTLMMSVQSQMNNLDYF
jgi:hypothetical protein